MSLPTPFGLHPSTTEFEASDALRLSQRLIQVGIALSSETDLGRLLELIVAQARELTHCDGASLFVREGEELRFFVVNRHEELRDLRLPLSPSSIVGYVVLTGESLNLPDVYHLPADQPYAFNPQVDRQTGYRTRSLLTVPMRDPSGKILGALQLLNRLKPDHPTPLAPDQVAEWSQPFSELEVSVAEALASQAAVAYQNVQLREELKSAHFETIFCLSVAAEYRDQDTSFHLKRMSNYSRIIAKQLGLSSHEQELIFYASPMHDVGKIGIPDAILQKPGRLTPEERQIMNRHPEIGYEILSKSDSELMKKSAIIALTHHEKFDGSGYPRGLKGEGIPLEGRIVALADVFDALASRRPYKEAWALNEVFQFVEDNRGSHFDPQVVAAFNRGRSEILEIYHRYQETR
ncbi:GAF domain protein [Synechococcus sp. JA-2-3B'a(2-13)]|uniref:HD domain-containing phosphohydrolase n=1 Tax=Synechococcus sp. (strain JA-2-3B'a(2-13)) TaxID=321332 RepID=UPI0000694C23|nr:HD domain-containing phosphohydrolase [Synechococcus sp. JA-2-3B'a(2-13)]ABD01710.1 GAF domain protein [Synechococcus sp. JA-2-3B'a(2-13)]